MEFSDVINGRESIRDYDPGRPVPKEVLKRILDAGRIAPSAANRQPWKFLVVQSPEMLAKIHPCYAAPWFQEAPHVLVVVGKKDEAWVRKNYDGYCSTETDATIAMDHMILAAENEGIGTCWIAAFDPAVLRSALELGDDEVVYAITPLGYQKDGFRKKSERKRKPLDEVAFFI